MRQIRWGLMPALLMLAAVRCIAADQATLVNKVKPGKSARYRQLATIKLEFSGQKIETQFKEVAKVNVKEVGSNGNITLEQRTESSEMTVNGTKRPSEPDNKSVTTWTFTPAGVLLSYKNDKETDKKANQTSVRLYVATSPVFPEKALAAGEKWIHEVKANDDLGTVAGKAEYTLVDFEQKDGLPVAKITLNYTETQGAKPIASRGTLYVTRASGDVISSDLTIDHFPFGPDGGPDTTAITHDERIEGSLYEDVKPGVKVEEPPKDKVIDEVVKDYKKLPGLFTLYTKRDAGRDTIYLEIREDQLDKLMLMEVTAETGTSQQIVAGDPINDILFKFAKSPDDRILLVSPNISFRADDKDPIARAVRRSYADSYLEVYKVEAKQKERKSLLIDISELFKGDIAELSSRLQGGGGGLAALFGGGGGSYSLDREKTFLLGVKSFPRNLSAETSYNFNRNGGGGGLGALGALFGQVDVLADARSFPIKINYTIFPLDDDSYRPRLADPRIGYFQTEYQTYSNPNPREPYVRYIQRWHVEKADPKAALSAPKQPIVFWLDNAIPLEYRDAVREGLLMWNKAFEKIGIKDAIVVNQMPDNAEWDHADMRYNTIRWVASPNNAYAVAQARANPLTGEVINANITVDASYIRAIKSEHSELVDPAAYFQEPLQEKSAAEQALAARRCERMSAEGMKQAWLGEMAISMMAMPGAKIDEKTYLRQYLRETVCHEMGHILGLRHNFIASTYHSLEDLKNKDLVTNTGVSSSVMDYEPFNLSALKAPGVDYYTSTIGPYDLWAIRYGYQPIDGKVPQDESYTLKQIASECNLPGHLYQSDEIADQFDPAVVRFDLGRDPLAYWTRTLDMTRFLILHLGEREPKHGESYWEFTRDLNSLIGLHARAASVASRYIGGLHVNRNHRGDPGERPTLTPISGTEQRQALDLLNTYLFSSNSLKLPTSYYTHLTANPNQAFGTRQDFPIFNQLSGLQTAALNSLFSTSVLSRIVNNEFKTGDSKKAMTLPTLFHAVGSTVWSDLATKADINALHRQLQRAHLDLMINMVLKETGAPADARMLAWDQLRQLKSKIALASRSTHDEYTRIHLDESMMRIQRALSAQQTLGASGGGVSLSALSALFGKQQ